MKSKMLQKSKQSFSFKRREYNSKENSKIRKKEIFIILLLYIKNTQNVNKIYRILISD